MTYKLTIDRKPAYLHAVVTGINSRENVARYLEDVLRECSSRGCSRMLIEERLEGPRLDVTDVVKVAAAGSVKCGFQPLVIAYVDVNAAGDLMGIAAATAASRWLRVAVFPTVAEAEGWLAGLDGKTVEPG